MSPHCQAAQIGGSFLLEVLAIPLMRTTGVHPVLRLYEVPGTSQCEYTSHLYGFWAWIALSRSRTVTTQNMRGQTCTNPKAPRDLGYHVAHGLLTVLWVGPILRQHAAHTRPATRTHMYTHIYMYTQYLYVYTHRYIHIYIYIHTYMCVCICIYIYGAVSPCR